MREEKEIKEWMEEILSSKLGDEPLQTMLRDGVLLCDLINTILKSDTRFKTKCPKRSQLEFFQMENIEYFINYARLLNVPDSENFQTIDLFEGKNMRQVYTCIYSLSRNLFKNGRSDIRVIGPKLVDKVSITFTKEQLDEARRTVSRQYGSINYK